MPNALGHISDFPAQGQRIERRFDDRENVSTPHFHSPAEALDPGFHIDQHDFFDSQVNFLHEIAGQAAIWLGASLKGVDDFATVRNFIRGGAGDNAPRNCFPGNPVGLYQGRPAFDLPWRTVPTEKPGGVARVIQTRSLGSPGLDHRYL